MMSFSVYLHLISAQNQNFTRPIRILTSHKSYKDIRLVHLAKTDTVRWSWYVTLFWPCCTGNPIRLSNVVINIHFFWRNELIKSVDSILLSHTQISTFNKLETVLKHSLIILSDLQKQYSILKVMISVFYSTNQDIYHLLSKMIMMLSLSLHVQE